MGLIYEGVIDLPRETTSLCDPLLACVGLSDVNEKRLLNVGITLCVRKGDRVIMTYVGLLENGTQFDRGQSEFVLGEKKVSFKRDCASRLRAIGLTGYFSQDC